MNKPRWDAHIYDKADAEEITGYIRFLGEQIKKHREAKRLNFTSMGKLIGLSRTTIARMENKKPVRLRMRTRRRIAIFFAFLPCTECGRSKKMRRDHIEWFDKRRLMQPRRCNPCLADLNSPAQQRKRRERLSLEIQPEMQPIG